MRSHKCAHKPAPHLRWTSTPHTRSCLSYTFASFSVSSSLLMLKSRSAQVDPLQLELALVLCLLQLANSIMFYIPARFQLLNSPSAIASVRISGVKQSMTCKACKRSREALVQLR